MAKKYSGKIPSENDGWFFEKDFILSDGEIWKMFLKKQPQSDLWVTVKIVVDGVAERKANYWFSINTDDKQIGFARDYFLMRSNKNSLFLMVNNYLNKKV